jgi:fermentation-respiration switch protein FrsA (DUF1100 family)
MRCYAVAQHLRRHPVICLITLAMLACAAALWMLGSLLIAVTPKAVALPAMNAEAITLHAGPGQVVAASYLAGQGRGAILLLHGIRADRRQMVQRARFLHEQGYAILLIDLPGQGASTADAVTFGLTEAEGVRVALAELRRRNAGQRIGVIGVSLGAASLVLCRDCGQLDAVVLESMYPTIEEAVADRLKMRFGAAGGPLSELLLMQLPLRLGISREQLRPIDHVGSLKASLLIAAGSADQHTTLPETQRLFQAAAEPKELWVVAGAGHVDLHAFSAADYERRIGVFMARNLRRDTP